jgi:hypothetical protein
MAITLAKLCHFLFSAFYEERWAVNGAPQLQRSCAEKGKFSSLFLLFFLGFFFAQLLIVLPENTTLF